MFEAYKVGVKISLINHVSAGLLLMSRQFAGTNAHAQQLQKTLIGIKTLGAVGAAAAGAGFLGLGIIAKMVKPATEYAHQLNIMNMAGLKQKELADAIGDAWKNTGTVITTTATENLRSLLDLRNVLGNMDEARMALPVVSRIQAVLASSSEGQISGNSKDLAYSMAKALDIIGAAQNKQSFERQAEMMSKVIIATQGRVTPEAFKSTFQYARQARYRLSDEFKYEILPSLIQENAAGGGGGGGSRGVGPMLAAFYRMTNQGFINKKSLPELQSLGLVSSRTALKTTTEGTTVGAMTGADLAASNPFAWVQTVLMPALRRKYGNMSKDQMMAHVGELTRGNQLAASLIGEFAYKPVNFQRDQANIRGTMSTADAYKAALGHDPNLAMKALSSQWENFKVSFTMGVVPVLVPALIKLSKWFMALGDWARAHPTLAKSLAIGFTALFGALALGGVVAVATAGFKALGLALAFSAVGGVGGIIGMAKALPLVAAGLGIVSATVLSIAAGLAAAGFAGWKVGGFISDHLSDGAKNSIGRGVAKTLAFFGNDEAQAAVDAEDKYIRSRKQAGAGKQGDIYMDGRKVGEIVSGHQSKAAAKPQAGASRFDGRMTPAHVGATGNW